MLTSEQRLHDGIYCAIRDNLGEMDDACGDGTVVELHSRVGHQVFTLSVADDDGDPTSEVLAEAVVTIISASDAEVIADVLEGTRDSAIRTRRGGDLEDDELEDQREYIDQLGRLYLLFRRGE